MSSLNEVFANLFPAILPLLEALKSTYQKNPEQYLIYSVLFI